MAALVAVDQLTKRFVRARMGVGETLPVVQDVLHITYVRNRGAAFSMFWDRPLITVAFPVVAMCVCLGLAIVFIRKGQTLPAVGLSLVTAGGIGNLIDRLTLGYVTDMLDFRIFPVFNVADIAVTCGALTVIAFVLFFEEGKGGRHDGRK